MSVTETQGLSPSALPVIRALTADLEHEPLVAEILFLERGIAQLMFGVVLRNEILDDSARLP